MKLKKQNLLEFLKEFKNKESEHFNQILVKNINLIKNCTAFKININFKIKQVK